MRGNFDKYMGLPSIVGKSKYNNTFRCIKERVWEKVNN